MSEESKISTGPRRFTDGEWEAHYVVRSGDPAHHRLAIMIEHETRDGKSVVGIPLTGRRARALVRLLTDMLIEAGEAAGEVTEKPAPLHPRPTSLRSRH